VRGVHRVDKSDCPEKVDCQWTRGSRSRISCISVICILHVSSLKGNTCRMPVTQSLPIILRGASVLQGPAQMTRVDRLASWWWSWTRAKPIHLGIWRRIPFPFPWQGSAFSESPPARPYMYSARSMISNAYNQLLVGSAGTTIHCYVHPKCVLQAYLWQTRPKSIFLSRTSQLPSIGLNLIDQRAVMIQDTYLLFQWMKGVPT
jgi:hypothetical protein